MDKNLLAEVEEKKCSHPILIIHLNQDQLK